MLPGGCPVFINNLKFNKGVVLERNVEMESLFRARKEAPDRPDDAPEDGDPTELPEEEEGREPPKD